CCHELVRSNGAAFTKRRLQSRRIGLGLFRLASVVDLDRRHIVLRDTLAGSRVPKVNSPITDEDDPFPVVREENPRVVVVLGFRAGQLKATAEAGSEVIFRAQALDGSDFHSRLHAPNPSDGFAIAIYVSEELS